MNVFFVFRGIMAVYGQHALAQGERSLSHLQRLDYRRVDVSFSS
jgi:hypothetical protein